VTRWSSVFARRGPTVVLMYHRVGPEERDLHRLRVRDDRFAAQVTTMQKHAAVVPLEAVLEPSTEPRVVITFDDGYADNLRVAEPILAARDAPATVFVAAGVIERGAGFWQDRLAALVLDGHFDVDHIDVTIAGRRLRADVRGAAARERAYRAVHVRIRKQPPEEIERVIADVAEQLGLARDNLAVPPTLTVDEVRELGASRVVAVGSHTVRHPMLSKLDEAAQRRELVDSRRQLEAWTAQTVRTFAYPYGVAESFDDTSVRVAREARYTVAVTGIPERINRFTDPYRVPRQYVGDWDADEFETHLTAWLAR
jgi:peptidoglycan/xylan/chitin deacetylase (PgdA/CDA1 family)